MCKNATIDFCDCMCNAREVCREKHFDVIVDYLYEIGFDKLVEEIEEHGQRIKTIYSGCR